MHSGRDTPTPRRDIAQIVGLLTINASGLIQSLSPALGTLLGTGSHAPVGQPWLNLIAKDAHHTLNEELAVHNFSQGPLHVQVELLANEHPQNVPADMFIQQTHKDGMSIIVHTQSAIQPRLEELEAQLDTAQQRIASTTNLVATVSHELRTPLNGILGLSQLLMDTRLNDEQHDQVSGIDDCGRALLSIVNDLLDITRIDAGKLTLEELSFDPADMVEQTISALATLADDKGLQLIVHIDENIPSAFLGDPARLRQVLVNLAGNAIKFTTTGHVMVELQSHTSGLHIHVKDTGIGISTEAQGRLFHRYAQADTSTSRLHGGSGLGLAISQQLMHMMGGEIKVTSTLGHGSTFTCVLPHKSPIAKAHTPVEAHQGEHVLWVSPSPALSHTVTTYLKGWGFQVHTETDLVNANRYLQRHKPNIILLDADLGTEQLFHLTRRLTGFKVIVAATFQQRAELRAIGAQKTSIVSKPLRRKLLERALRPMKRRRTTDHFPQPSLWTTKPKVLIAEDNRINQKVVRRIVSGLGYECTIVPNGQAAVDACQEEDYAALLMDSQMPVLNGYEATRTIRQLPGRAGNIPIIALTADVFPGTRDACRKVGMDDYLAKPVHQPTLAAALKRWAPLNPEDAHIGLSPHEREAIGVLFNKAMGAATAALRDLSQQAVILDVPQLDLLPIEEVSRCIAVELNNRVSAVQQEFHGTFGGDAYLLFPDDRVGKLVAAVRKTLLPADTQEDMTEDILQEVGNIVLGRSISSLCDTLEMPAELQVAQWSSGTVRSVLIPNEHASRMVLFLRISMSLGDDQIPCYVLLSMSLRSVQRFRSMVSRLFADSAA